MKTMSVFRDYSLLEYPENVKNCFAFLINDYGYELILEERSTVTYTHQYAKGSLRVLLNYDIRDNAFYYYLIRGDIRFPQERDPEKVKSMYHLFKKYDPNFNIHAVQPNDNQYLDALKLTAQMLKKYGDRVLRGKEWF